MLLCETRGMGHHGDCEGDIQHSGAVGAVSLRKLRVKSSTLVLCPAMIPIVTDVTHCGLVRRFGLMNGTYMSHV